MSAFTGTTYSARSALRNLSPERLEGLGRGVVPGKPEDAMARVEQLSDGGTTDEACGSGDGDAHDDLPADSPREVTFRSGAGKPRMNTGMITNRLQRSSPQAG
jgi:hypothetical protein